MGIQKTFQIRLINLLLPLSTFFLLFLVTYLIFKPSLHSYFFQDDWFTFDISKADNVNDVISFFVPRTDVIYYRPLGMQLYFFIMNSLFGINHVAFRISVFIINSLIGYVIIKILQKFNLNYLLSLLGGLLYVGSVAIYIPFFWSATFPFVLGPLFFFVAFLSYISADNKVYKFITFLLFILGLLTLENTIILPALLFFWGVLFKNSLRIKDMFGYAVLGIMYFVMRTVLFPTPLTGTYSVSVNLFTSLRAYGLWMLNWPEEVARQFIGPFSINSLFMNNFKGYFKIWIVSSSAFMFLSLLFPSLVLIGKNKKTKRNIYRKQVLFGIIWIAISLMPLMLFSDHLFPYYLPVTMFGFILVLVSLLDGFFKILNWSKNKQIIYSMTIVCIWLIHAWFAVDFNSKAYWAFQRAALARNVIDKLNLIIKPNTKYMVTIEKDEYFLPLNGRDALKIVFGEDLETVYGEFNPETSSLNPDDYKKILIRQ